MLEKTLESPLDSKEIQPVNPKGNQSWIFIRRTDAEAETPILWPPDAKNWLIGKDPGAGRDWRQEEKGTTEDEMVDGITDSIGKFWELVVDRDAPSSAVHGIAKSQTQLSDWTELNWEYWSGLPCPPPGDLPNPGIKLGSPVLEANSLPSEPSGKPITLVTLWKIDKNWITAEVGRPKI